MLLASPFLVQLTLMLYSLFSLFVNLAVTFLLQDSLVAIFTFLHRTYVSVNSAHRPLVVEGFGGERVATVATGGSSSFAITESGRLYSWGFGTNGQLGSGEDEDIVIPTLVKGKRLVPKDGTPPARVLQVDAGGQHTVILAAGVVQSAAE